MNLLIKWSITALVLVLISLIVYNGFVEIGPKPESEDMPQINAFETDFGYSVKVLAQDFASIRRSKFEINSDYDEVCFLKTKKVLLKDNSQEKYSFNVSLMDVESDFCLKPVDNEIEIRIEGRGDYAKVSIWS